MLCAPGGRRSRVGVATTETPAIPSTAAATSTVTRRVETLRTAIRRTAFQPGLSAAPKPTAAGSAITSAALAAAASTTPAPCAVVGLSGVGAAVPTRTPFSAGASSQGRIWASTAAAPPASAAAALEPLIVPYRADLSAFLPGSAVTSSTPAIATSGLTPPPKERPWEENGAIRVSRSFARQPGAPSETPTSSPRARAERTAAATAGGSPTTGTSSRSSRPRAPAGTSPSTRIAAAPARTASRASSVGPVARARSAARPATRLYPRSSK